MQRFISGMVILAMLLVVSPAWAKDLRERVGAGIESQMSLRVAGEPSPANLSVKYTLPAADKTINIQLELLLGLGVVENDEASVTGGARFLYTVVAEDNCNVFLGVGAAYLRGADLPSTFGYVRLQPLAGVEFFFYGLENLGFTTSVGLNVDMGDPLAVSLTGAGFGALGIHYYF